MNPIEFSDWIIKESEKARKIALDTSLPNDVRTYQFARLSTLNEVLGIHLNILSPSSSLN